MKQFIKDNWYWIGIIIVLISLLTSRCSNDNIQKKDTVIFRTVTSKKELPIHDTIIKKFVKIKTVTKYVDRVVIDTMHVRYKDSIPCVFDRSGELKTKEYSFIYKSNQNGFTVNNFDIKDSLTIVTGTKRKWLLGKQTNTIDIYHSNKYVKSDSIQYFEVVQKKKFYETTLFKVGIGFIAGVAIMK